MRLKDYSVARIVDDEFEASQNLSTHKSAIFSAGFVSFRAFGILREIYNRLFDNETSHLETIYAPYLST